MIVSRLYNEMNKSFRYTIIHCMLPVLLVNLHTQASLTSCDENTAADLSDFLRNADMHMKKKKRNLTRTSKEHAIKDDI